MNIEWLLKKFEDLTPSELYDIIRLRNEVFVVEQNCVYQDADNRDQQSLHLSGRNNKGDLLAYCRILPPGLAFPEPSIGRVVNSPVTRRTGTGKTLMTEAIKRIESLYGKIAIKIGAQLYLKRFYESLGFVQTSDIYLEDGIKHIEMVKTV